LPESLSRNLQISIYENSKQKRNRVIHTDTLLLYNWDRYLATKDNNWFIIGYDGRQVKVQSDVLTQLEATTRRIFQRDDNDFTKKVTETIKSII
jgi:hypothetical protein